MLPFLTPYSINKSDYLQCGKQTLQARILIVLLIQSFLLCLKVHCVHMAECFCLGFFFLHRAHSSTSLWRNLEWVTTGFSPSDTFQIFSTSQKLTRKSVHLFFVILVLHVRNCVWLITNVSHAQLFALRGCSFSCVSIFFLPPCRNILPCCCLPLAKWGTLLPAGNQPGEHLPPVWHSQHHSPGWR